MSSIQQAFEKAGRIAPSADSFKSIAHDVDTADKLMQELSENRNSIFRNLTTSKLRNILSMISEISDGLRTSTAPTLSKDMQDKIGYLRIRLAYECGRDPRTVKPFVEKANLLKLVKQIGDSRENFMAFSHYMEALVAYHRFYGGKD